MISSVDNNRKTAGCVGMKLCEWGTRRVDREWCCMIKHQKREKIEVKKRDEGETQGKITPFL
jgi:hypothetical protein